MTSASANGNGYGILLNMPGNPVSHFGKQVRKERLARGWSLDELSARTGIAAGHWSRIENSRRPPTLKIAQACDAAFPERKGYFVEYYAELQTWAPPGFRDWPELENKAVRLYDWSPGVLTGLVQTEGYAEALLSTLPGADAGAVQGRLANRLGRQRHVLMREDPPSVRIVIDELALYRRVGSAEIMSGQLDHVMEVANLPHVAVQVLPAAEHPATASGFIVADDAAYVEHVLGGGVYTDDLAVPTLTTLFDALRTECYGATESLAIIRKARKLWIGASPLTQARKADRA
jgi:transcriptional regulator with XRE-family HTH domain